MSKRRRLMGTLIVVLGWLVVAVGSQVALVGLTPGWSLGARLFGAVLVGIVVGVALGLATGLWLRQVAAREPQDEDGHRVSS